MKTAVLINKGGGTAQALDREAVDGWLRNAGVAAGAEWLDGEELAARAGALVGDGVEALWVGGGDGTIGAAAGVVAGTDTALGVLPLGTLNHFARDLGLPATPEEAVAALAGGRVETVDIASVNGRCFVNNSAIGLYPLMVVDREAQQQQLGRSKRLAMLVAGLRTLARFRHQRLRLRVNGAGTELVDTPLLFVGNNDYRTDLSAPGCRDRLDDGQLCVLVMRAKSRTGFFLAMLRALVGRGRDDDMVRLDGVTRLEVGGHRSSVAVSLDGESSHMALPLDYRIHAGALRVVVPAVAPGGGAA